MISFSHWISGKDHLQALKAEKTLSALTKKTFMDEDLTQL